MIEKDKSYEKMPQNIMSERETVLHFIEHSSFVGGHDELLQIVIDLLKKWSGCDAVAIRLREKNDYPYFATSGFPEHFPSTENNLISVNGELRCLCGSVISGKSDIKGCHYTEYGSFWVNHIDDSPDLANKTIGCIKNGFSSMALIPLKNESESLGLLQCNSYSNHCFNSEIIGLLECLASSLSKNIINKYVKTNESVLNQVHEISSQGSWDWDLIHEKLYWSHNMYKLYGLDPSKPPDYIAIKNVILKEDLPILEKSMESIYKGDIPDRIEYRIKHSDGSIHHISSYAYLERDKDKKPIRLSGIVQDISVIKKAERKLIYQRNLGLALSSAATIEEFLEICLDHALVLSDMDGGGIYLVDDVSGDLDLVIHKGLPDEFIQRVKHYDKDAPNTTIIKRGAPHYVSYDQLHKRLGVKKEDPLRTIGVIPIWSQNEVIGAVNIASFTIKDIPNASRMVLETIASLLGETIIRFKKEGLLKRSEEMVRYQAQLVESVSDAVISTDMDFRIVSWNRAAEDIYGWKSEEAVGELYYQLLKTELNDISNAEAKEILLREKRWEGELRQYRKDGSGIDMLSSFSLLETGNNGPTGTVAINRDITRLKMMQTELQQSQKMRALGQLAGGIAHDFNNVLTGIIGYAELMGNLVEPDSKEMKYADNILNAGIRAREMVKQILTFSRQGDDIKKPINLKPIIEETIELLKVSLPSSVKLVISIEDDSAPIIGDPNKIHEVLMNLATNAVHAMDEKGTLTITHREVSIEVPKPGILGIIKPGAYSLIEVKDTGSGMSPQILPHIFEPFFTTKDKEQGTGLGLSVVFGIIQSHHGDIQINSYEGLGTTFKFYLSKNKGAEREETHSSSSEKSEGESILFIDDEEMIRQMSHELLKSLGYRVTTCKNGVDALTIFKNKRMDFDLLITDQTMPLMSGIELASEVHKIDPRFPIILCTGFSTKVNRDKARNLGINNFVRKPMTRSELSKVIRAALQD